MTRFFPKFLWQGDIQELATSESRKHRWPARVGQSVVDIQPFPGPEADAWGWSFHWKGVMVGWNMSCQTDLYWNVGSVWEWSLWLIWHLYEIVIISFDFGSCLCNQTRNLNVEVLRAINQIQTKTVSMKSTVSVSEFNTGYQMHFTEWIQTTLTWLGFLSSFFAIWCFVSQDAAQTWQNRWRRQSMEVYAEVVEIQKLKWHWSHRGVFLYNLLTYGDKPSSLSWNHFWNNLSSWFLWCFFQCSADFSSWYPHLNLPAVLPSKDPEAPMEAAPAESRGSWARSSCGGVAVTSASQTVVDFGNVSFVASTRCFQWFEDVR